jgi:hypothetical protein
MMKKGFADRDRRTIVLADMRILLAGDREASASQNAREIYE